MCVKHLSWELVWSRCTYRLVLLSKLSANYAQTTVQGTRLLKMVEHYLTKSIRWNCYIDDCIKWVVAHFTREMYWLAFCHCDKVPEKINMKKERLILDQMFWSVVTWNCRTGACDKTERASWQGVCGEAKLLTSWQSESKVRKQEKRAGDKPDPQVTAPWSMSSNQAPSLKVSTTSK